LTDPYHAPPMIRPISVLALVGLIAAGCTSSPTTTTAGTPITAPPTTTNTSAPVASTTTTVPQAALDIRSALDGYSNALSAGNGADAIAFLDSETLDLFDDLVLLASSAVPVNELDFLDAFLVLRLRHRFSSEQLKSLTAADIFLTALDDNLAFPQIETIAFDSINIVDSEATGIVGGSPAMWFSLEEGAWKIALGRTFEEYAPVLGLSIESAALAAAGDGATRDNALLLLLSKLEGTEIDRALLTGPRA